MVLGLEKGLVPPKHSVSAFLWLKGGQGAGGIVPSMGLSKSLRLEAILG